MAYSALELKKQTSMPLAVSAQELFVPEPLVLLCWLSSRLRACTTKNESTHPHLPDLAAYSESYDESLENQNRAARRLQRSL